MTKKSNNPPIVLGVVIALVLVGVCVYIWQNNQSTNTQSKNCTTYNGTIDEQCTEEYVGLSISEAMSRAKENGLFPKTIKKDGKTQGFTDFGRAPIYFEVEKDVVTRAYFEDDRPS